MHLFLFSFILNKIFNFHVFNKHEYNFIISKIMEFGELIHSKINWVLVGPNIWDIRHSIIDSNWYANWIIVFLPSFVIYMRLFYTCLLTLFSMKQLTHYLDTLFAFLVHLIFLDLYSFGIRWLPDQLLHLPQLI